jgi:hypothetical protein
MRTQGQDDGRGDVLWRPRGSYSGANTVGAPPVGSGLPGMRAVGDSSDGLVVPLACGGCCAVLVCLGGSALALLAMCGWGTHSGAQPLIRLLFA